MSRIVPRRFAPRATPPLRRSERRPWKQATPPSMPPPAVEVPPSAHRFRNLETIIDEIHALFAHWAEADTFAPTLDAFALEVLKLTVHEWVANLVQHATFTQQAEISLTVSSADGKVRCTIDDNSEGFDFHAQLDIQDDHVRADQAPDRGRGLLMMIACTEDLSYRTTPGGTQRLAFWFAREDDPWINVPF